MAEPKKSSKESFAKLGGYEEALESLFGTLDPSEFIEKSKKEFSAASFRWLRGFLFEGLGLEGKSNPEYLIVTGCITGPFWTTLSLLNYFRLLDRLGVAYTFLKETEYCCGHIALSMARAEDWEVTVAGARELMKMNLDQARELGVKGVVYYCTWCFGMAQTYLTDSDLELLFYLDILKERLEGKTLRVEPTVVGYYPSSWRREDIALTPQRKLAWMGYRDLLDGIEGVTVVELPDPHIDRPTEYALAIIPEAERLGVDCIVTPDTEPAGAWLKRFTKIPVKLPSDILLEALV